MCFHSCLKNNLLRTINFKNSFIYTYPTIQTKQNCLNLILYIKITVLFFPRTSSWHVHHPLVTIIICIGRSLSILSTETSQSSFG